MNNGSEAHASLFTPDSEEVTVTVIVIHCAYHMCIYRLSWNNVIIYNMTLSYNSRMLLAWGCSRFTWWSPWSSFYILMREFNSPTESLGTRGIWVFSFMNACWFTKFAKYFLQNLYDIVCKRVMNACSLRLCTLHVPWQQSKDVVFGYILWDAGYFNRYGEKVVFMVLAETGCSTGAERLGLGKLAAAPWL